MSQELSAEDFARFFEELHEVPPFPWQQRLAQRVCAGEWPRVLDLPTATGKTACIDIAIFAMAVTGRGPRRIFFVVDRRVIVDAAFERMRRIASALRKGKGVVVRIVAERLRGMAQSPSPLDVYQMRGGIYRDLSWVRSPLQPTAVASTVDQVGSRLLFRGYGVWDKTLPIHAAMTANDALILLDEAHCSEPFGQTLEAVRRYRAGEWSHPEVETPFAFVQMTATPGQDHGERFVLDEDDDRDPILHQRLYAPKLVETMVSKGRARDFRQFAEDLAEAAVEMAGNRGVRRIGVMVNRVHTARLVYAALKKAGRPVSLVIGRMRPVDRSGLTGLDSMLSGKPRRQEDEIRFVVATQCLEVGADLDFDAVVTECASIDALVQRFGRLDRTGALWASGDAATGRIVAGSWMLDGKQPDPIYGDSLKKTWDWLRAAGSPLNFGLCSADGQETVRERLMREGGMAADLRRVSPAAPMLLPAHLDLLAQTSPRPELEPNIHWFLHGKEDGAPEVQVVWRADLDARDVESWAETVALSPPVTAEAMPVPLTAFRRWLEEVTEPDGSGDIEGVPDGSGAGRQKEEANLRCPVIVWRGDQSKVVRTAGDIQPGDTVILLEASNGWQDLGHIPDDADGIDAAERARTQMPRGWLLRLHPVLIPRWPDLPARGRVLALASDGAADVKQAHEALREYAEQLGDERSSWLAAVLGALPSARQTEMEAYPTADGQHRGWVLTLRAAEPDAGQDESCAQEAVPLADHLDDVHTEVARLVGVLRGGAGIRTSLEQAARYHDCGKADLRFQALLRGGDLAAARFAPVPLAKGAMVKTSAKVRQARWRQSGLPEGFRHELVSVILAGRDAGLGADDLALHLIASHHGRCRPFAPVVADEGADVTYNGWHVSAEERAACAAHRLDSGVADRFWNMTRRYGWWGLAYLEALLRLGDWDASACEAKSKGAAR
jgi:CRISPR-associated endonuclease/helicase Cas3